jgi:hypothetical protein
VAAKAHHKLLPLKVTKLDIANKLSRAFDISMPYKALC